MILITLIKKSTLFKNEFNQINKVEIMVQTIDALSYAVQVRRRSRLWRTRVRRNESLIAFQKPGS
jgi:hypothetical protein